MRTPRGYIPLMSKYPNAGNAGYLEHGLKDIAFYVQKHIEMGANCHKFRSSSRPPAWSPHICESRLLPI